MTEPVLFEARVRGGPPLRATLAHYGSGVLALAFLGFLASLPVLVGLVAILREGFTPAWSVRPATATIELAVRGGDATRSVGGRSLFPHPLAPLPSPLAVVPGAPATVPLIFVMLGALAFHEAFRVARWRSTRHVLRPGRWITRRGVLFTSETVTALGHGERLDVEGAVPLLLGPYHEPLELAGLDPVDVEALVAALRGAGSA